MIDTEVLILKTIRFRDTGLILQALSPSLGKISIYAKGARRISKKNFPAIGLFRVLSTTLVEPKGGDLYKLRSCEIVEINDSIAGYPDLVDFATAIGLFSLHESFSNVPCPLYFHTLKECLSQLCNRQLPFSGWICRLLTCHLMEHGLFPELQLNNSQKKTLGALISDNYTSLVLLNYNNLQWEELQKWILKIAAFAEIQLPNSPFFSSC